MLRLISDEQARQRWAPVDNPYAGEPSAERTLAYQWAEFEIAVDRFNLVVVLAVLRLLRRLPFCG